VLVEQSTHMVPFAPHADAVVPAWQVVPPQQPEVQAAVIEQDTTHWLAALHALPKRQFATVPQPQKPPPVVGSHRVPAIVVSVEQEAQSPPFAPHAPLAVPGWQVPPVAAEQQPVLQGWLVPHAVTQVCVLVSQAKFAGQSAALAQPQTLLAPLVTHAGPAGGIAPAQLVHIAPVAHSAGVLPATHFSVPGSQQPPLQA